MKQYVIARLNRLKKKKKNMAEFLTSGKQVLRCGKKSLMSFDVQKLLTYH